MIRRHFFTTLSLCLTLAIMPFSASAEPLFVDDTNDGYLNMRAGPGVEFQILQRLYGGTRMDGVGQSGTWRRVVLPDGTQGWVSGNFVSSRYTQMRSYDAFVAPTNDGYLNLRAGPGTDFRIVQRMYAGQGLFDIGRNGNWLRVRLPDGTTGWASQSFLQ